MYSVKSRFASVFLYILLPVQAYPLGLIKSPYNRRSKVNSYCFNTDQLAKPAAVDSRGFELIPMGTLELEGVYSLLDF
jgi:hypothetical protein